jgi:outer membrane receptor for ferrienterochelin and colicins
VGFAAALALSTPAFADNTADEADLAFQLGNESYAKRDYDAALSHYFLSHRLVPNRNVLFNIAKCYEALNKVDEAYRYYNDLAQMNLPADDRREVKSALARLAGKVALLSIDSDPQGADIYVDREDLGSRGKTPQTLAVSPGAHKVTVKLTGSRPADVAVQLVRGREVKQKLELKPILGKVRVTGSPEGAIVRERPDGPELGRLPASIELKPGQVLLHISAPGYLPSQALVKVEGDGTASAKVELTPQPRATGKVVVTANREGAEVKVDGIGSGFTPTVLALPAGEYQIDVVAKDLRPYSQRVTVVADQEVRIVAELRYAPPPVRAASKSLVQVDDSPASITVITREEILGFGWQTLAEAMAAVRGVFTSNDRIYSYIGVRGFSPPGDLNTRILILWDGHAMNDVWAGQGYSARDLDVDLSEIERIEIVRGPGSALYGTGAFFAVVNLVPRTDLGDRNVEGVVGAGGLLGAKVRASGGFHGKSAGIHGSAAGFISRGAETTDLGDRGVVLGLDGERTIGATLYGHVGDVSLQAKWTQRRKQVPTAPFGAVVGAPAPPTSTRVASPSSSSSTTGSASPSPPAPTTTAAPFTAATSTRTKATPRSIHCSPLRRTTAERTGSAPKSAAASASSARTTSPSASKARASSSSSRPAAWASRKRTTSACCSRRTCSTSGAFTRASRSSPACGSTSTWTST